MPQRNMRREDRGSKTQFTPSRRVESLMKNQPVGKTMREEKDAKLQAVRRGAPTSSKTLKKMLAAVNDGPTMACLQFALSACSCV